MPALIIRHRLDNRFRGQIEIPLEDLDQHVTDCTADDIDWTCSNVFDPLDLLMLNEPVYQYDFPCGKHL